MRDCLVVDDSAEIRTIACRMLSDLAFDTRQARDGKEALAHCREHMPDGSLLDWNMPQMNGLDFLEALAEECRGMRPVVVFCSGENDVVEIARAIGAGADEYMMKPFDREILEAKLQHVGLL